MSRRHIILGMFSAIFGIYEYVLRSPFPDDMMALVTAFPPSWVTLFTTLFLPLVFIVAGLILVFGKVAAAYVLAAAYAWLFVIYIWATAAHFINAWSWSTPTLHILRSTIAWGLLGGVVFYGLLAFIFAVAARAGPQYNKPLKADTGDAGAS